MKPLDEKVTSLLVNRFQTAYSAVMARSCSPEDNEDKHYDALQKGIAAVMLPLPMEIAPKDGTVVWLFSENGKDKLRAEWWTNPDPEHAESAWSGWILSENVLAEIYGELPFEPTGWFPDIS